MNSNDGESKSDGGRNVGADATGNARHPARATIARIWRGRTRPEKADAYEAYNFDAGIKPLVAKVLVLIELPQRVQILRILTSHGRTGGTGDGSTEA